MNRIGVIVHPRRPVQTALEALQHWAEAHGLELVQVGEYEGGREVAPPGDVNACDLVAAIGGDGTVLRALHAAAKTDTPVLGVACGSLAALPTVSGSELPDALDDFASGHWFPRRLPALTVDGLGIDTTYAINDFVLMRSGGMQLITSVSVEDDLYARVAGDGVVVATALGSRAYSMAAGGPLLVEGTKACVCAPLAMHGGCAPPLVIPHDRTVRLEVEASAGGFETYVDGRAVDFADARFEVGTLENYARLVGFGRPDTGLPNLRRRGLIIDSPRVGWSRGRSSDAKYANPPPPGARFARRS